MEPEVVGVCRLDEFRVLQAVLPDAEADGEPSNDTCLFLHRILRTFIEENPRQFFGALRAAKTFPQKPKATLEEGKAYKNGFAERITDSSAKN
jgi:hypothetical protein